MSRISRADNRSREAAEKQLAERFLNADKRMKSTLLAIIPANLSNKIVCITLIDGTRVTGTLMEIDGFSNITLGESVIIDPPSYKKTALPLVGLKQASILGKRIRYIGLPKDTKVKASISEYLEATKDKTPPRKSRQSGRGRGGSSWSGRRTGSSGRPSSSRRAEKQLVAAKTLLKSER
nr:Mername AA168 protein (M67 family) [Hymenolepis microstoma]